MFVLKKKKNFVNAHWVKNKSKLYPAHVSKLYTARINIHKKRKGKMVISFQFPVSPIRIEAMKCSIPFILSLMLWLKNLLTNGRPWHWIRRRQYHRRLIHAGNVEEYRPVSFAVDPQTILLFSSREWCMDQIISVHVSFFSWH